MINCVCSNLSLKEGDTISLIDKFIFFLKDIKRTGLYWNK